MAHGKGSRKRNKDKRLASKLAKKQAMRAAWDLISGTSANRKKKVNRTIKSKSRFGSARLKLVDHPYGRCGNLACNKCYPEYPTTNIPY